MRRLLRTLAVVIAVMGIVDPAFTWRSGQPAPVEIVVPPASHPGHLRAVEMKQHVVEQFGDLAAFAGLDSPRARLAIGGVTALTDASIPVYALPVAPAAIEIQELDVPETVVSGQQIVVQATVRARSLQGRASDIQLQMDGVTIASVRHEWTRAGETHTARFVVPGQSEGMYPLRAVISTDGDGVAADAAVRVTGRPLRVLAYEPRPSWPIAFVRRALEADDRFEVSSVTHSAPRVATTTREAPRNLSAARLNAFDALLIGALDALEDVDINAAMEFVARRGGSVVLMPDGRVPESLRTRLTLPAFEETLLQEPATIEGGGLAIKASELLLPKAPVAIQPIAVLRRAGREEPVIFSVPLGAGQVVFSGALDAWRYRGAGDQDLGTFVRSLTADAAVRAPRPVEVALAPVIGRPAEPVMIRASVRHTEFADDRQMVAVPPVSASVTDASGHREMIRLWPTTRMGEFSGTFTPADAGRYQVTVAAGAESTDSVLVIRADVTHAQPRADSTPAVAALTGGEVVHDLAAARSALGSLAGGTEAHRINPMRSPWWIVPFTAALAAEWILRRRAGLR